MSNCHGISANKKTKRDSDLHRDSRDKKEIEFEDTKHDLIIPVHLFDYSVNIKGMTQGEHDLTLHFWICPNKVEYSPAIMSNEFRGDG